MVSTNGVLTFGTGDASFGNTSTGINNSIHAFWDDLILLTGSRVYATSVGEEGSRKFITQWTSMYFFSTTITMGTFQAILYEETGEIQLQYRDLLGGDRSNGDSATIGIKNSGSTFLMYSHNTVSITQGQAIRYTPSEGNSYTVNTSAEYDYVYLQSSDAPDSPVLVNPQNGATGSTVTPTFEWLTAHQATSYQLLISTVSNFSSTESNITGITDTNYTLGTSLDYNTTYYWRVVGVNAHGTNMSGSRSFTTASAPNAAPEVPSAVSSFGWNFGDLIGPSKVTSGGGYTMTLADSDEDEQVRYRIQISRNDSFSDLLIDFRSFFADEGHFVYSLGIAGSGTYLVGTSETRPTSGDYYVRIRTEDDGSASSDWYEVSGIAFSYDDTIPATPVKPFQIGEATATGTVTIGWEESEDDDLATTPYILELSQNFDFSTKGSFSTASTERLVTSLSNDTYYYFRLAVVDAAANISEYSEVLTVYIPPALTPTLLPTPSSTPTPAVTIRARLPLPTPTSTSEPTEIPVPQEQLENKIILDLFEEYKSGDGIALPLTSEKVIYFFVQDNQHSAKVKDVSDTSVTLTISSEPFDATLAINETGVYDVDKDGVDDIEITYQGLSRTNEPLVLFKPVKAAQTIMMEESAVRTPAYWWVWLVVLVVILGMFLAAKRK